MVNIQGKFITLEIIYLVGLRVRFILIWFFWFIYKLLNFTGLLPKSALTAEEEAWNSYPYTKTRYTCPFVEKFSIEIETYYYPDNGHQDNVFKLSGSDMRNRSVGMNKQNYMTHQILKLINNQQIS